jgi:hypothetical protein
VVTYSHLGDICLIKANLCSEILHLKVGRCRVPPLKETIQRSIVYYPAVWSQWRFLAQTLGVNVHAQALRCCMIAHGPQPITLCAGQGCEVASAARSMPHMADASVMGSLKRHGCKAYKHALARRP